MIINKIIKMKNNKYKIVIDGNEIITYDDVILDNGLLYLKTIDDKTYNKINDDTRYYDIYNKIVKGILKKRKSEYEIREYLVSTNLPSIKIDSIIDKLKNINLINDIEYAKAFINDKLYLSKFGIERIKLELLDKNVPIDIINRELNNIDSSITDDRLEKLIVKKINSNKKYSNDYLKQKVLNEMLNLGYSKESIIRIFDENVKINDSILINEYKKNYAKLKLKYSGIELKNKVISKLMSVGFKYEDIKLLIEKTEE